MTQICVFWESIDEDGWAKVTGIHHQPAKLDEERKSRGLVITPTKPPILREGWHAELWVNSYLGLHEYRVVVDKEFRVPAGEFLASLPIQTRVAAKAAAPNDPVLQDFLELLDMMVYDSASKGLHPASGIVQVGLGYLVQQELMTQAQADAMMSPFEEE